jgi:glycine/D-amino acid oxidase-like deaminating enzyme
MNKSAQIVICGAGIGGVAAAYFLTVHQGMRDVILVDERPALSLTSDKSTECYRNWWPGPGDAMVQMMNRSIDLMDSLAEEHRNIFHLNRRGYLYTTTNLEKVSDLEGFALEASSLGAGDLRRHEPGRTSNYRPHAAEGFRDAPNGADLITDPDIIQKNFPYLSEDVAGVLHVRRAGWLSAQQYGMLLLEQAKASGASLLEDRVVGVETAAGEVDLVHLASGEEIRTEVIVNAAGPLLAEVGEFLGLSLPVFNELHMKASINDSLGIVDRDTPLLIDIDPQYLEWSDEEREWLSQEEDTSWLLELLPSGAHVRPEGSGEADTILMLWDTHTHPVPTVLPAPADPMYPEVAIRGLCKMLPGMAQYLERMPKPFLDSGYYTKTEENRSLACPLPLPGAYMIGAMSGYGIMAAAGLGELVAAHIVGGDLPRYAAAFDLQRYSDAGYQAELASWGDNWQL